MVFLLLLLVSSGRVEAQYYSLGSDPGSIKWSQHQVDAFKLVFPGDETGLASRYSQILRKIVKPVTASMQADIRSTAVILHPYTSYSNGSAILAPRRIELFSKQPISLETNDFASQLLIHEVRHFAQMDRLNTGVTHVASYLLGDQAQSVVLGIHVPKWLLEGDAVLAETLLSHSGRGRIAGFIQPLRSRLIDHRDLSWDRVSLGSYTDNLPDEYLFGYFLTARGRMLADPMIWSDAMYQIGRNPFLIKGLSGLTRPKTGYRFSKLYVETMEWLRDYWTNPQFQTKDPDNLIMLAGDTLDYANYFRPHRTADGKVICLKKGLGDIPSFILIDSTGNERIIARPGYMEDAGFSYYNGTLVWTELIRDPRWENRSWSDLYAIDIHTGRKSRITKGQRLFSPVFSPDGNQIAMIEERSDGSSWIQVFDWPGGRMAELLRAPDTDHFSFLCWGADGDIFAITTGLEGRKLVRIDSKALSINNILEAGYTDIASPVFHDGRIYFTGPAGATQGLYRIASSGGLPERVFSHRHGINYLTRQGEKLMLSVFSSDGYRPAVIAFTNLSGKAVSRIEPLNEPVTGIIQRADGEFPVSFGDSAWPVNPQPYSKISHLFRLHSWSPLFLNPDSYQISPGVVLMSQNELSTLTSWAGYQFHKTDRSHNLLASLRYTGLYPELDLDYTRKFRYPDPDSGSSGDRSLAFPGFYWQFIRFGAGIPLDFTSGSWNRKVKPSVFFEQINEIAAKRNDQDTRSWRTGLSLESSILRKRSYRDLFPKWGIAMSLSYFKSFTLGQWKDNYTARMLAFLPGFLPNSSLRILNSAISLSTGPFFNSIQDFPRGQVVYEAGRSYNLKIDYAFPVSYPDYHISWLLYIKRIKANLFFDASTGLDESDWFSSTGIDITLDYNLFRSGIDLESGARLLYFPLTRKFGAEFLFSFSVN